MFENVFPKYMNVKNIIFFVALVIFIAIISKIGDIAIMFFASFVLSCSMDPLVQKLEPKFGRSKASAIVLGGSILCVLAFFIPIIVIGGNEIKIFADNIPQYIESLKDFLHTNPIFKRVNISNFDAGGIISSASTVSSKIFSETISLGKNVGSGFVYLLISLLVIYYFMVDKDTVKKSILRLFPVQMRSRTSEIYDNIFVKIGGYVIAQIVTMASVGIMITLGLLLLRVNYALLLGLISTVFEIIPVAGPATAFVICLIAVYKYGPIMMILTTIVFFTSQIIQNNFIRPYVFGKLLNLHPLIIYLFLFIAAKYMGVVGVLFAPAIAALAVVLVEDVYIKSLENK